ncbi:MAG: SMC-Scp complex subunit ScpB, partial [Coriobacteriaceae bacterium]|nr:SMC-Scp complex subunit ScpB [Coriobacteriaceae bacterium]
MFPGLQEEDLASAIEAMLFISDEPVSTITMAGMLKVEVLAVQNACELLADRLEERGGIMLQEVAGGWRLSTKPRFHGLLEQYVLSWDTRRLSKAMLEVLAVVAYAQPVTRASIAQVRGVNSDSSLNSLLEKGLVRESGFADSPGNPALYSTTRAFLEKMG